MKKEDTPVANDSCTLCTSQYLVGHLAREMMFGTREVFRYLECRTCGCVQLAKPYPDPDSFYPSSYYSLASDPSEFFRNPLRRFIRRSRDRALILGKSPLGRLIARARPNVTFNTLNHTGIQPESRILDVGSGTGKLLQELSNAGFTNLVGIDPYIKQDQRYGRVRVLKRAIQGMEGQWDLVMFHHVFEHLADPFETLESVRRLLAPNGKALIRIPVAGSWAWKHYGTNWVQLDAPRHLFLHTPQSMRILAERAGLRIVETVFDSTAFQFWGSELYQQDIALIDADTHPETYAELRFGHSQMSEWEARSDELNREGKGDQAAFVLAHAQTI